MKIGLGIDIAGLRRPHATALTCSELVTAGPSLTKQVNRVRSVTATGTASVTLIHPAWAGLWVADDYNASAGTWTDRMHGWVLSTGGASKPTLDATGIGGLNAVKFLASSTQWLTNTTTAALYQLADGDDPNITVIVQAKFASVATSVIWFFGGSGGASANRMDFGCANSATVLQLVEQGASGGAASRTWTVSDVTAAPHIYAVRQAATVQKLYVDAVDNGLDGAINVTARTAVRFTVGAFSSGNAPYNGWIRRLGILPYSATANEIAGIQKMWEAA